MDDPISRQAAIKQILLCENHDIEHDFEFNEGLTVAMNAVNGLPTADLSGYCDKLWKTAYERGKAEAQPKKGKWISDSKQRLGQVAKIDADGCPTDSCHCSVCGDWLTASDEYAARGRYCPNCGARMEES